MSMSIWVQVKTRTALSLSLLVFPTFEACLNTMPALSKNSKTQTLKVEDATRFRSRSRGDSGAQGQVMCVRSSGSSAGPSNDQASAIVRSSEEKKDDDENPVPIEVLEEGEETCMEVLQTNMILHDIAQIMQLITDRMDAKQKRDQLKAQGQVGGEWGDSCS